jgi:predicted Zn-dependent protease with MMP-like domain
MRNLRTNASERRERQRFERLVRKAIDSLPPDVLAMMDNVEVVVDDEPTAEHRGDDEDGPLGLYEGYPHEERGSSYTMVLPDKITIFRGPLERATRTPSELFAEVRATVIHEVAHHFGMDERQIAELGYE